jgi:hypothetical protein
MHTGFPPFLCCSSMKLTILENLLLAFEVGVYCMELANI